MTVVEQTPEVDVYSGRFSAVVDIESSIALPMCFSYPTSLIKITFASIVKTRSFKAFYGLLNLQSLKQLFQTFKFQQPYIFSEDGYLSTMSSDFFSRNGQRGEDTNIQMLQFAISICQKKTNNFFYCLLYRSVCPVAAVNIKY